MCAVSADVRRSDLNWQMEFLQNLIESAKAGTPEAIDLLRDVVRRAADSAPADDLIQIAQGLYDMRAAAAKKHIEGN